MPSSSWMMRVRLDDSLQLDTADVSPVMVTNAKVRPDIVALVYQVKDL